MSKEKQIEEMALTEVDILSNDIYQHCPDLKENYCGDTHCVACLAHALTAVGYRKASDVIDEFAERLKERFSTATRYTKYSGAGVVMVIDQITKEMLEGEK